MEATYWQKKNKTTTGVTQTQIFLHYVLPFVLLPHWAKNTKSTPWRESFCVSCKLHAHVLVVTAAPAGCPWRRWPAPPAGSSPAVPASAWWWCRPSAPGRRCCPSAGPAGTDAGLLWLWGTNTTHITSQRLDTRRDSTWCWTSHHGKQQVNHILHEAFTSRTRVDHDCMFRCWMIILLPVTPIYILGMNPLLQ